MANMTFGANILPKANANATLGNSDNPWTIVSPSLTGTPTAPTATSGTNTTQVATTAFVTSAISNMGEIKNFSSASATSHSFTVASGSEHFVIITSNNATICYVGIVLATSNGNVAKVDIATGSGTTVSIATNTLTIGVGSTARKLNIIDVCTNGSNIS